jgi:hypothetical protein
VLVKLFGSKNLMTKVVNIKKYNGDYLYIGRGSKWGNPFKVGKDGTREEVIIKYEKYIRNKPELMADLMRLEGQVLGCFCKPKPCHGDVLVKLLRERRSKNETKICNNQ